MNKPQIIYEDNHLLIVNKSSGLLAQGDETRDKTVIDLAKGYIKEKYNKPGAVFLGLTHRIDRPVSGCLILAKTSKALQRINRAFAEGKIEKQYLAMTQEAPPHESGEVIHYLIKDAKRNRGKVVTKSYKGAKRAVLHYRLISFIRPYYLLDIRPSTGRPHQIRIQLLSLGCPIVGDKKYGSSSFLPDKSIALHCYGLRFEHPVRKEMMVVHAQPDYSGVWRYFAGLLPLPFDSY